MLEGNPTAQGSIAHKEPEPSTYGFPTYCTVAHFVSAITLIVSNFLWNMVRSNAEWVVNQTLHIPTTKHSTHTEKIHSPVRFFRPNWRRPKFPSRR